MATVHMWQVTNFVVIWFRGMPFPPKLNWNELDEKTFVEWVQVNSGYDMHHVMEWPPRKKAFFYLGLFICSNCHLVDILRNLREDISFVWISIWYVSYKCDLTITLLSCPTWVKPILNYTFRRLACHRVHSQINYTEIYIERERCLTFHTIPNGQSLKMPNIISTYSLTPTFVHIKSLGAEWRWQDTLWILCTWDKMTAILQTFSNSLFITVTS